MGKRSSVKNAFLRFYKTPERIWPNVAGWKVGIAGWACVVGVVLVLNIVLVAIAITHYGYANGSGVLLEGSCSKANSLSIYLHLLINVLGSLLLSGSNYSIQCLTAPSRRELDRAHKASRTLEIGTASFRNLLYLGWAKTIQCIALLIVAYPLHLLYNPALYTSLASNSYIIIAANEAFLTTLHPNIATLLAPLSPSTGSEGVPPVAVVSQLQQEAVNGELVRLDPIHCIKAYGQTSQSQWRNLILMNTPVNSSTHAEIFNYYYNDATVIDNDAFCSLDPVPWVCPVEKCYDPCIDRQDQLTADPSNWSPFGQKVQYCLAEEVNEHCKLNFSVPLAATVIVFNGVELIMMLAMIMGDNEPRMRTIGDAIRSYLAQPDPTTAISCLKTAKDFKSTRNGCTGFDLFLSGKKWKRRSLRFYRGVGRPRWLLSFSFLFLTVGLCIGLLVFALQGASPDDMNHLFSLGIGQVLAETIIFWDLPATDTAGFLASVFIANSPQILLSCTYFIYNNLFTSMLTEMEWSEMAWQSKGLRVSERRQGAQRSTYFLQLPYRYAIPLLMGSSVMQWIVSQSLFFVAIDHYGVLGQPVGDHASCTLAGAGVHCNGPLTRFSCGWSPNGLVGVIAGLVAMIAVALIIGHCFRLRPGMPLGGRCSAVLSAACHIDAKERSDGPLEDRRVQWGEGMYHYREPAPGATPRTEAPAWSEGQVARSAIPDELRAPRHLAFSAGKPGFPQEGVIYR